MALVNSRTVPEVSDTKTERREDGLDQYNVKGNGVTCGKSPPYDSSMPMTGNLTNSKRCTISLASVRMMIFLDYMKYDEISIVFLNIINNF